MSKIVEKILGLSRSIEMSERTEGYSRKGKEERAQALHNFKFCDIFISSKYVCFLKNNLCLVVAIKKRRK